MEIDLSTKEPGHYYQGQPSRKIILSESIYQFAWMCTLTPTAIKAQENEFDPRLFPTEEKVKEIFVTAIFCAFTQLFTSMLLIGYQFDAGISVVTLTDWRSQIARFICASLFHFKFCSEILTSLRLLKYTSMHWNEFHYHKRAIFISLI